MTLKRVLSAFVLATAVAAVAPACIVTGTAGMRGTVAYSQPPPPQEEVVEVRTGQVWIRGRWDYQGGQWVWINGRWEQDRSGYRYNDGQWVQRGSSWHWVEGQWVAVGSTGDGSVVVSDGRNNVIVGDASEAPGGVEAPGRVEASGRVNARTRDVSVGHNEQELARRAL
ncbi:MAG TPA: YXWGXW repeat-containing protein, partial [Kofleriaceae bacterium]|nr:YXWGXW repeat-containing protein [Kofleriaceae bacterium]